MSFNYDKIPQGFYDKIFDTADGMRKFWHWHKFDSVVRSLDMKRSRSLLDVGCFSGTFTGKFISSPLTRATGIDILPEQIAYASEKYGCQDKTYLTISDFEDALTQLHDQTFDAVTFIEVIEHLNPEQIESFFKMLDRVTHKGSEIVITTPNYLSLWPILELMLNRFSDVQYEEQHITKFNILDLEEKLAKLYPQIWQTYELCLKTTSHFITPFIAAVDYDAAMALSAKVSPINWRNPFGCILILKLIKR
jgi:2-polyprenyl-3-methyl-5-hydroxy-6-metoxy-1,4-benzoquinol methylase